MPGPEDEDPTDDDDADDSEEEEESESDEDEAPEDADEEASEDDEEEAPEDADEEASEDDEEEGVEVDEEEGVEVEGVELPVVDDDVYGSSEEYGAEAEDFEDDTGDWSHADYNEVAETIFGDHEFFGDTAQARYLDEGFTQVGEDHPIAQSIRAHLPQATTFDFFERDGSIVPRGFLTNTALDLLGSRFPDLDLSFLRVTVPRRPLLSDGSTRAVPAGLLDVEPADSVDLRKYATPIGDQGSTSRCAAFAWTHALEMLGNTHQRPFPRLAPSFTMYRFQQLQGDSKDFTWAWKGGDGTSGTWQPGHHLFSTGTCRQDYWPDDEKHPRQAVEHLETDAQSHTFEADVYDVDLEDIKKLLTQGLPVQLSMATGDAFQDIGRDGVMKLAEAPKGQHGYHAMLCVGYIGNYFIVKNSWGEEWGDQGYCYIPKKVLAESEPEAVAIVPRSKTMDAPPAPPAAPPVVAKPAAASAPMSHPHFCTGCGAPLTTGHFCAKCGTRHD